jgi:hypothetical protein
VKQWKEHPHDLLGALATAGKGTWIAMQAVTYKEAHSMRTRLRFMQADLKASYATTPRKLVELASTVHWFVEDVNGVRELKGLRNSPRLKEPIWKLIGSPSTTASSELRLPKNVDRLIEEVTK